MDTNDVLQMNSALFLRLMELAREDIKDDVSLHFITEAVTILSKSGVVTMDEYDQIISYWKENTAPDELDDIKRLGGMYSNTPNEVVAPVEAVTTSAGGGVNGPKHPADIRVKDPRGY